MVFDIINVEFLVVMWSSRRKKVRRVRFGETGYVEREREREESYWRDVERKEGYGRERDRWRYGIQKSMIIEVFC